MKTKRIIVLMSITIAFAPLLSMERPSQPPVKAVVQQASFDSFPGDVKRLLIPLIASGNVAEVANTILSLNRTSKAVRAAINTPAVLISILERMPYTFKAIALVEHLQKTKLPVAHDPAIIAWVAAARAHLESGTALFEAVENGNAAQVAELLRNKNIDINSASDDEERQKYTVLMTSSFLGHENIVKLLLEAGADLNLQNEDGWTALMLAASENRANIVERLLIAGADQKIRSLRYRRTARDIAVKRNNQNIIELLDGYAFMAAVLQTEPEEVAPLLPPSSKKPRTE